MWIFYQCYFGYLFRWRLNSHSLSLILSVSMPNITATKCGTYMISVFFTFALSEEVAEKAQAHAQQSWLILTTSIIRHSPYMYIVQYAWLCLDYLMRHHCYLYWHLSRVFQQRVSSPRNISYSGARVFFPRKHHINEKDKCSKRIELSKDKKTRAKKEKRIKCIRWHLDEQHMQAIHSYKKIERKKPKQDRAENPKKQANK